MPSFIPATGITPHLEGECVNRIGVVRLLHLQTFRPISSTGYGSVQNAQQAASRLAAARASVARDKAALDTAVRQTSVLKAELAQAQAARAHDEAVESQAELNLSYATIVSPVDGVVGARTLRVGQYVQAVGIATTSAGYEAIIRHMPEDAQRFADGADKLFNWVWGKRRLAPTARFPLFPLRLRWADVGFPRRRDAAEFASRHPQGTSPLIAE